MDCIVHGVAKSQTQQTFTHFKKIFLFSIFIYLAALGLSYIYECILGHDKNLSLPVDGGQESF